MGDFIHSKKHAAPTKGRAHAPPQPSAKSPNPEQMVEHLALMRAGLSDSDFAKLLRSKDDLLFTLLADHGWRGSFVRDEDYLHNFDSVRTNLGRARAAAIAQAVEVGNRPAPQEEEPARKAKDFQMSSKFLPGGFTNEDIPYGPDPAVEKQKYEKEFRERLEQEKAGQQRRFIYVRKFLTRHGVSKWAMAKTLMDSRLGLTIDDFRVLEKNGLKSLQSKQKDVIAALDRAVGPDDFAASEYQEAEEERLKRGAQVRHVLEKTEAVAMSGPASTVGRVAGALTGWITGHDTLQYSEYGAQLAGPLDAFQFHGGGGEAPPEEYFQSTSPEKIAEAPPREPMPAPGSYAEEAPPRAAEPAQSAAPGTINPQPFPKAAAPVIDPAEAEFENAFARLESGGLADEHGAMLGDLMFHFQRREAMQQLREQVDANLRTRPGKTPEGVDVNPNPGYQSAHMSPQAAMRDLPEYNPGEMITRFLPTGKGHAHTVFDQHWQAQCREILNSGRTEMTAQEVYEVVSRAAMESGAFSPAEGRSVSALVANDLFFQLKLSPTTKLRVPGS